MSTSYVTTDQTPTRAYETASRDHGFQGVPSQPADSSGRYGIVTLNTPDFRPKGPTSTPPSVTGENCQEIAIQFAVAYNQSQHARNKGRWAVVMINKMVLFLTGIHEADRPIDPRAFPKCVQTGYSKVEAELAMMNDNRERYRLAHIPRSWTVAVIPLLPIEAFAAEGGEAC